MAYDELLAAKIRALLKRRPGIVEIKMFGGLCFTLRGNMACGILDDWLIIRVAKEDYPNVLREPHVRPFDITGRPLKGIVYIEPGGIRTSAALKKRISQALSFAASLPAKMK